MKNRISKQFQASQRYGRMKLIQQKFKSFLQALHLDPHVQKFIFQLIQNAKDTPNQFEKVRIMMILTDTQFKFMHNGDPFTPAQIQSLISQFSQKGQREKNITGKYGTGFITSYVLSKYLKIEGLLQPNEEDKYSDKIQNLKSIQNIKNSKKQLKQIKKEQKQNQKKQIIKKTSQNELNSQTQFYYPFQIELDRNFGPDRDQNITKLINTEQNFANYLENDLDQKKKWKRHQKQFNTVFTYQKLQKKSFDIIQKGMNNVMQLFGYTLLFNDNLFSIEFIDERTEKKLPNFKIEKNTPSRRQAISIYNVPIFSFKKVIQGKQQEHLLAFREDESGIVAIPVKIHTFSGSPPTFELLEINKNYSKTFKEFPLIGCQDTGFNFIFTSTNFQPKENRKELILQMNNLGKKQENQKMAQEKAEFINQEKEVKHEDYSIQSKIKKNWDQITKIFQMAKKLTKNIGKYTYSGIQNSLIMTNDNDLTRKNPNFIKILEQFIKSILSLKIIKTRHNQEKSFRSFENIHFILFLAENGDDSKYLQISKTMNEIFRFLFGVDSTLNLQLYEKLYQKLVSRRKLYQKTIKFINLEKCLRKISQLQGFDPFQQLLKPGEGVLKLRQIYLFLAKYQPKYLDFTQLGQRQNLHVRRLRIYLNNNLKLVSFDQKGPMKIKINLPIGYEQIANYLKIDFNENIMHEKLANIIQNYGDQHVFNGDAMMELFKNHFNSKQLQLSINKIQQLCSFLKVFNKSSHLLQIVQAFKVFHNIQQFKISKNDFQQLSTHNLEYFEGILKCSFIHHVKNLLLVGQRIDVFSKNNLVGQFEEGNFFKLFNHVYKISQELKIEQNLLKVNQNNVFANSATLKFLEKDEQLTPQDYNIYRKFIREHQLRNRGLTFPQNIRQILLNTHIQNKKQIEKFNFGQYFLFLVSVFNYTSPISRKQILDYAVNINSNLKRMRTPFLETKYLVFREIIEKRHESIISNSEFQSEQKDFIYGVVKSKDQLQNLVKLSKLDTFQNILQRQQQHRINLERIRIRPNVQPRME